VALVARRAPLIQSLALRRTEYEHSCTMERIAEASPRLKAKLAGVFYLRTILMGVVALVARGKLGFAGELIDLSAGACYMAGRCSFMTCLNR
jgi:hypothetical protein